MCGPQGELETNIGAIDLRTRERKPDGTLYATELAGVALRGVRKEQVRPGDVLELSCELVEQHGPVGFGKAAAKVDGKLAARCELTFVIQ